MSKTVATYLSKDIQEDWDALCKNCGLESPSDILRYAIKQAAKMQNVKTSTLEDFKKNIEDMGLPELEQEYKKLNDKGKQSLQDKKNGVWHYDIYYNDLRTFIDHQAPIEEIIAHSLKTWKVSTMFKEICRRQNMPIKTWDDNHRAHSRKFSKLDETYVKMRKIE
jgi:hypothetical protein